MAKPAMMTVYFDDSGTHPEGEVAVAACFVSDVGRWKKFCISWANILEEAGILEHGFHMADFVARVPPFNWAENKRDSVYQGLLEIINKHALAGMATAVIKKDYDALVTGRLRDKLGHRHYTFAVQSCLAQIEFWAKQNRWLAPMRYEFDRMPKGAGSGEINDLFEDLIDHKLADSFGIVSKGWGFSNRRELLPLQTADILAWEASRYMRDNQFTDEPARLSFLSLVNGGEVRARFFDRSTLPEVVSDLTDRYSKGGWKDPRGGFFVP